MLKPTTTKNNLASALNLTGATLTSNPTFNAGGYNSFVAFLNVSAHTGSGGTLDVKFQDSIDGTNFVDISSAAFTQVTTANGIQRLVVSNVGPKCRAVVVAAGTSPNFTFSLDVSGL